MLDKLSLAHLPTPLWRHPEIDSLVGAEVWVKRDDMTAGAEAGNKIRKLEYLLADAQQREATAVITCGAVQSNHARATAILARSLGMRPVLLLRTVSAEPPPLVGNLFLDRLVAAEVRLISPEQYRARKELMNQVARELEAAGEKPYVIPEGGSNGLGALGYVTAMAEVRAQLERGFANGPAPFDAVVHACGSGGTAAGVSLGAAHFRVAERAVAMAVCDDATYFTAVIERISEEARALLPGLAKSSVEVIDAFKGPAYGQANAQQLRFIAEVAHRSGLVLDPVYTGKALYGLAHMDRRPRRVLFIHTGGLPGLLAANDQFSSML